MYIRRVKIRNVRGFDEVDLDFTRPDGTFAGWTVLAGRNGSGKSTLLKALALAVAGPPTAHILSEGFLNWIRLHETKAKVAVDLAPTQEDGEISPDPKIPKSSRFFTPDFTLGLEWKATRSEELLIKHGTNSELPWTSERGWFLAGYGPYRRLSGHATDALRLMTGPDRVARLVSLFREDSSLIECVQWLREIYLRRLEGKPGSADLEQAVLSLLNDGLLPDGVRIEAIDSDGLWVTQLGTRLMLNELSDGYRTTAAFVMDLVRHLHRCFGVFRMESARDEAGPFHRVLHEGVVLIDEVDLHLHVSWQQRIGFWLKRHFPNIQFIVTTHSPFICQAADPGGLIRLPAPGENRPAEQVPESLYNTVVNGSLDDAVLTDLFGLESPYSEEAERLRQRVAQLEARLQSGKAKDRDRQELKELRARLPQNLSTDVEQVLRRLAIHE